MITLNKEQVANWMLLSYKDDIRKTKEKIALFKQEYASNFTQFECSIKNDNKEDFEQWDDYMEWKAFEKSLITLSQAIDEISGDQFNLDNSHNYVNYSLT